MKHLNFETLILALVSILLTSLIIISIDAVAALQDGRIITVIAQIGGLQ